MKSVIQEGSSLAKAIEQGWIKAGKPKEFTIKIFQEAKKNFFGMTVVAAKVGIFFKESIQESKDVKQERRVQQQPRQHRQQQQPYRGQQQKKRFYKDKRDRGGFQHRETQRDNKPQRRDNDLQEQTSFVNKTDNKE